MTKVREITPALFIFNEMWHSLDGSYIRQEICHSRKWSNFGPIHISELEEGTGIFWKLFFIETGYTIFRKLSTFWYDMSYERVEGGHNFFVTFSDRQILLLWMTFWTKENFIDSFTVDLLSSIVAFAAEK